MSYSDQCKIKFLNINGGDMPDSQYFALKGYTSISRLKLLNTRDGSPQKYLDGFSHEYNPSLLLGTSVHTAILQPDEFEISNYQKKPSGKLGYFIERAYYWRTQHKTIAESISLASDDSFLWCYRILRDTPCNSINIRCTILYFIPVITDCK